MIYIIIGLIALIILIFLITKLRGKKAKLTTETIVGYIGGLGSGKTLRGTTRAIKEFKKSLKLWKKENNGQPQPLLISNIPLRFKYKGKIYNSILLDREIVLMEKRIPTHSIVYWDEIGLSASQFDWDLPEVKNELTEFIRMYRQYTKGGLLIYTDQTLDAIVKPIRNRTNVLINCLITNSLWKFYCTQCVYIRFTQHLDSYTADSLNDLIQRDYGVFMKNYSTYAYYERYVEITKSKEEILTQKQKEFIAKDTLTTDVILKIRKEKPVNTNSNQVKKSALEKNITNEIPEKG